MTAVEARADLRVLHYERRYFRSDRALTYEHAGRQHVLRPDVGYVIRWGDRLLLLLVELDRGTMSRRRIREKLVRYQRWLSGESERYLAAQSQRYATHGKGSIRIGFIVQNARAISANGEQLRLASIMSETLTLPASLRERLWLTTWRNLIAQQQSLSPHQHQVATPVWYRARDAWRSTTQASEQTELSSARQFHCQRRHLLFPQDHT